MDYFAVSPGNGVSSAQLVLLWLEASVLVVQISIIALILMAYPLWRMLPRVGFSKWWALLTVFPPAAIVLVWVAALRPWEHKE